MGTRFKFALAAAALIGAAACTVHQADPGPAPFGPSDFALSIGVTANPDSISYDGASQSLIIVTAQDANGAPKAGVVFRLDMELGGEIRDFGRLSARTVVTGTDGRATAIYTAPSPSSALPPSGFGTFVTIVATPSGTNAQALNVRLAEIRLVPPGVILPPAGSPTARFTITPTPVVVGVAALFDASTSEPGLGATSITSYNWSFGDGSTGTGVTRSKTYGAAGNFLVTLTVTNDRGISTSSTQSVTVQASGRPVAIFTVSPDTIRVNQTANFNGSTSTAATGRTIVSYDWDFGDGERASGATTTHAYKPRVPPDTGPVTYKVTLTVTDDLGQTDSDDEDVDVDP